MLYADINTNYIKNNKNLENYENPFLKFAKIRDFPEFFLKFLNLAFSIRGSACVHTSTMTATRSGRRDERYYWSSFDAHGSAEPANNTEDVLGIGNRSYVIMPTNVRQAPYISTSAKSGIWSEASSHVSVRSFPPPV